MLSRVYSWIRPHQFNDGLASAVAEEKLSTVSAISCPLQLRLVVLAGFIDEARRHEIRAEVLVATKRGISAALERGKASGERMLDAQTDEFMASLIAWHDGQLRSTPLSVIRQALYRLERLRDGKSFGQLPARR
ncbi:hypothetical protein [Burkholderia gladioli]|uniref:hypothetical protein n=1 Tax=Burkholderia gladioli TaxID=28095 RepID=UPI001FC8C62B|nr:hypothetical protein [Burkholderia gladioli]